MAGAAHVVISGDGFAREVQEITGNTGLRIVLDPIAGRFIEALVPCMAEEGIMFVYGGLSDEPTNFDRKAMIGKGASLTGYMLGQILRRPDRLARGEAFVRKCLADGSLSPHIDRIFPFEDVVEAHRYMESNEQIGKILLTV